MCNLIIAPHIDDEVLGCYSILSENAFVCFLGVEDRSYVSAKERITELENVVSMTKFQWELYDNEVNKYKTEDLIGIIEDKVNSLKPLSVFIPNFSYNQDHRAVYDASMVALRHHDINWFVDKVFIYEQPHNILWPYKNFEPNYFIDLNVGDKINTYKAYKSQVRGHRSPELIETMAKLRGNQSNMKYAEAFQCMRYVVREYRD